MKKSSRIIYSLLLLISPTLSYGQSLSQYQSSFNGALKQWTNSFTTFSLSDFKPVHKPVTFENSNSAQAKNLRQFYPSYKSALSTSPNGQHVLDIYSYLLLEKKAGRFVSTGSDVEQSILLGNLPERKWLRIAYYGYAERVQDVHWVNDDTFILAATRLNHYQKSTPIVIVGHIKQQVLTVFESTNASCYQKRAGYLSPKIAALGIKTASH